MATPNDESIKEIFGEVLEIEPQRRSAFLEGRCANDPTLRKRVRELLAAHERAGAVLGDPDDPDYGGIGRLGTTVTDSVELEPGESLGPYRILQVAGSGGFGTVYVARQTDPVDRRVALKVLRRGLSSEQARARFDAERQALARMEHPGIARVFDAGETPDGCPFFAMEYVDGEPLTRFCVGHELSLSARLELFVAVCHAVQHAHQKGVVHRDLKPSNVLVTEVDGEPLPKVIDFGVAKAIDRPLTQLTLGSVEGQLLGTPAYMSPEQAAGEVDVDTRADVYSLGVLLYELLTGVQPFDSRILPLGDLFRAIAEVDPVRPSERSARSGSTSGLRHVPSDLDWIAMRCLEKERGRRYPSANALALDVERYLAGQPVDAAPPSRLYRMRRFTRRHRVAVAMSVILLVALAAGAVGTTVGLVREKRANQQLSAAVRRAGEEAEHARLAEERANEEARKASSQWQVADAINRFVTEDLLAAVAPSAEPAKGREVLLREVLDEASDRIAAAGEPGGRFADKPLVEASIRAMIGGVYHSLGEFEPAIPHLRRALDLREAELGFEHQDTLDSAATLGIVLRLKGASEESERLLTVTHDAQAGALGTESLSALASEMQLGLLHLDQGRLEEAYEVLSALVERATEALGPEDELTLRAQSNLGIACGSLGRDAEAEALFRAALAGQREVLGDSHPTTLSAMGNLGGFLRTRLRYEEAQALLEEAHELQREVLGPDHPETLTGLYNLGGLARERGRFERSEELMRQAVEGWERSLGPDHPDFLMALSGLARALEAQGEREEAEGLFLRALEGSIVVLGEDHPDTDSRRKDMASFLFKDPTRREETLILLEESLASQTRSLGMRHPNRLRALANLATLKKDAGDVDAAEELYVEALEGFAAGNGEEHLDYLLTETDLAELYRESGRFEEAEALARHTVEVGERSLPSEARELARFRLRLGLVLKDLGRMEAARAEFERVVADLRPSRGGADLYVRFAMGELEGMGGAEGVEGETEE